MKTLMFLVSVCLIAGCHHQPKGHWYRIKDVVGVNDGVVYPNYEYYSHGKQCGGYVVYHNRDGIALSFGAWDQAGDMGRFDDEKAVQEAVEKACD